MLDLVCVGDIMLDVHLPAAPSPDRTHGAIRTVVGGSAVNAALAAARLGARVCVAGAVGDDPAGRVVAEALHEAGVESQLVTVAAPTGTCVYGVDGVVADRGANAVFDAETLPAARATLVSGYLGERVPLVVSRAHGLVAVDTQGRAVDTRGAGVVLGPRIDLHAYDGAIVCSTLGADGAAARGIHVRPDRVLPEPQVGAGDRFAAAFLLALADGASLKSALRDGCSAAPLGAH